MPRRVVGDPAEFAGKSDVEAGESGWYSVFAEGEPEDADGESGLPGIQQNQCSKSVDDGIVAVFSAGGIDNSLGLLELAEGSVRRCETDQCRPLVSRVEAEFQGLLVLGHCEGLAARTIVT